MALLEMVMPQMGESVMEGTIIKWLKNVGDFIKQDESVLEVATDKVDTEIPSNYTGYIHTLLVKEGDVVQIGNPIALISTEKEEPKSEQAPTIKPVEPTPVPEPLPLKEKMEIKEDILREIEKIEASIHQPLATTVLQEVKSHSGARFYSPLVLNIAREEHIGQTELDSIPGSGQDGRLTKNDILEYIKKKTSQNGHFNNKESATSLNTSNNDAPRHPLIAPIQESNQVQLKPASSANGNVEIVQMDRMRKMISDRMIESKNISAHVTSFVEADITNLIHWKNKMKHEFKNKENDTLTLTPLFIEAIARAIKDYPQINASVDGDKILMKKHVNIGMAVALPSGNLIVPVIKNVDQLNIVGITKKVNELAKKARENRLMADDLSDGTYTMSNVGQFGNVMGTPIIVQPQIAIMAFGTAVKKPAVVETPHGDAIGIRQMMFLSHSYDHRVVDGALGGMFVRRVADYLENFDINRKIW